MFFSHDEGVQQEDPLGPLLFCASSLKCARSTASEFNLWYLDDGSVGGNVDSLLHDLETMKRVALTIGLELNEDKDEIVTGNDSVTANVRVVLANITHIPCGEALLLGAPVGDEKSVDTVLNGKPAVFKRLVSRLLSLNAQDALFLLKNCFSTPKLLFTICVVRRSTGVLSCLIATASFNCTCTTTTIPLCWHEQIKVLKLLLVELKLMKSQARW
jgi:hypothetical protein